MARFGCILVALGFVVACGDDVPPEDAAGTEATSGGLDESSTAVVADDTSGSGVTDAASSSGGGSGTTGGAPVEGVGCDDTPLLVPPADPSLPGPWPVGVQTVDIDGRTAEVWYPAELGSDAGLQTARYDIRESLPDSEQGKISDEDNPWQPCDCVRDLPVDTTHGPYPAVFFIHGTAGFRTQSLPQMTHWASRGFVVISVDHPGLELGDLLGSLCGGGNIPQAIGDDVLAAMAAARGDAGGLEGLVDSIDSERFAVSGHSAGGREAGAFGDDAQVLIPMAAGGVDPGAALASTLVLGAQQDSVVQYSAQVDGYQSSPTPKRLVGIDNQGHLAFSSLCSLRNEAGDDLLTIANANDVCGANFAGALFQCDESFLSDPDTWEIVNFATAAVLEETLHCSGIGAELDAIQDAYPAVAEYRSE